MRGYMAQAGIISQQIINHIIKIKNSPKKLMKLQSFYRLKDLILRIFEPYSKNAIVYYVVCKFLVAKVHTFWHFIH